MKFRAILVACAVAAAIGGCGKKNDGASSTPTSAAAARVDAASPLDKRYSLKQGRAVDVDALFALLPRYARPTYDAATFDADIGAMVVTNLRFIDRDPDDDFVVDALSVERAELYGVDIEAINRVKGATTAAIDAPFEQIFHKVRLYGVRPDPVGGGEATTIGAVEFDQFRLRHGGFAAETKSEEKAARFFNAFDLAGLYIKDLNATGADAEGLAVTTFKAPDLRFVGIGGGKLAAVIANDLEFASRQSEAARAALSEAMGPAGLFLSGPLRGFIAPGSQRTTVDSFEWRGVDFSGLMNYGLKDEKPPLTARNLINLGTMKALNAEMFVGGKKAATVAETTVSAFEFTWLAPSKIRSATKGAHYDFTAYVPEGEEAAIAVLKKHGLDNVDGAGALAWDWNAAKGDAAFKTDFTAPALADFALSLDLAGLEATKISAAMEAGDENAVLKLGAFKDFQFAFTERTLLDAIFDMSALQMGGGSGADLRQSSPAMVRLAGASAAVVNPRFADYVDAVADFIAEGGTLEISARPEAAVPLQAIAAAGLNGPEGMPELINLTVTHTPKDGRKQP